MSEKDNDGAAFPTPWAEGSATEGGMSLRDWFAGQALAGLSSHYGTPKGASISEMPKRAYTIADAMLEERNK